MARQTTNCDLKTDLKLSCDQICLSDKDVITRHLPNEHKNPQEHANILQKFSMTLSLDLVMVQYVQQGVYNPFTYWYFKFLTPTPYHLHKQEREIATVVKEVVSCFLFPFLNQQNNTN